MMYALKLTLDVLLQISNHLSGMEQTKGFHVRLRMAQKVFEIRKRSQSCAAPASFALLLSRSLSLSCSLALLFSCQLSLSFFSNTKVSAPRWTSVFEKIQIERRRIIFGSVARPNLSTFRFRSILNVESLGLMNSKAREPLFSNAFSLQDLSLDAKGTIQRSNHVSMRE